MAVFVAYAPGMGTQRGVLGLLPAHRTAVVSSAKAAVDALLLGQEGGPLGIRGLYEVDDGLDGVAHGARGRVRPGAQPVGRCHLSVVGNDAGQGHAVVGADFGEEGAVLRRSGLVAHAGQAARGHGAGRGQHRLASRLPHHEEDIGVSQEEVRAA